MIFILFVFSLGVAAVGCNDLFGFGDYEDTIFVHVPQNNGDCVVTGFPENLGLIKAAPDFSVVSFSVICGFNAYFSVASSSDNLSASVSGSDNISIASGVQSAVSAALSAKVSVAFNAWVSFEAVSMDGGIKWRRNFPVTVQGASASSFINFPYYSATSGLYNSNSGNIPWPPLTDRVKVAASN